MAVNSSSWRICFTRTVLIFSVCVTSLSASAFAQDASGEAAPIRWGADQEGGGPYIYPRDDDPTQLQGFEVDLAAALGRELARKPEFVQCAWDSMLLQLDRGDIDIALNGYEYTEERAQQYQSSIPYYIYELALAVRDDNTTITSWDSLKQPPGEGRKWQVGVLGGSAADDYVQENFAETCDAVQYEGSTEAMHLVETGQIDATVQDVPILQFYVDALKHYPRLKVIPEYVAPGYYVIYARSADTKLIGEVDTAIKKLFESGELRSIYEKYALWNKTQDTMPEVWSTWQASAEKPVASKWKRVTDYWPLFWKAAGVTVMLAVLSMPLAVLVGSLAALIRGWNTPMLGGAPRHASPISRGLNFLTTLYIEIVRGTPLAFQLFVIYFVLPSFGITISAFWAGVVALAVNYSAYEAEIMRLGLQAIPRGQIEAALALGMPRWLAVRRIILPQAVRIVIPATANDFIALFKDTAVCSVIAVQELSKTYSIAAKSTGLYLEMALLASALYLAMSYPLSLVAAWVERRLKREQRG